MPCRTQGRTRGSGGISQQYDQRKILPQNNKRNGGMFLHRNNKGYLKKNQLMARQWGTHTGYL